MPDRAEAHPVLFRHFAPWVAQAVSHAANPGAREALRRSFGDLPDPLDWVDRLIRAWQAREAHLDALQRANRRLVARLTREFLLEGAPAGPALEACEAGLRKACGLFDHRRGYRLVTYAQFWVLTALTRAPGTDQERALARLKGKVS
ncbi:MAG: hypothetical protein R3F62_08550 [Planctomycetota bacterium]